MCPRLLLVLTLFTLTAAACASSPRHDSENTDDKTDANGCYLTEEYDSEEDNCYLNCDTLDNKQCDDLALLIYGDLGEFIDENFDGDNISLIKESSDSLIASYSLDTTLSLSEITNIEPENDRRKDADTRFQLIDR
jgi:hypothetical protein